jgi:hypothetical protein
MLIAIVTGLICLKNLSFIRPLLRGVLATGLIVTPE